MMMVTKPGLDIRIRLLAHAVALVMLCDASIAADGLLERFARLEAELERHETALDELSRQNSLLTERLEKLQDEMVASDASLRQAIADAEARAKAVSRVVHRMGTCSRGERVIISMSGIPPQLLCQTQ
jgi:hypothetical protein